VATTTNRLVRTPAYNDRQPRRGMLPISGVMILFSVMMFGLALAIPASRAIQEAEMRDRIAGVAATENDDEEESSSAPESSNGQLPSVGEAGNPASSDGGSPPPSPIELDDVDQGTDRASQLEALRESQEAQDPDEEESREPKPTHITVPDLDIDAEIHQVGYEVKEVEGQRVREWDVASYAAGHHNTSAHPGEGGNIVVTGHNDWEGEVFRTLEYAKHGQEVFITTEEGEHRYIIQEIHMRREVGASLEERLETGRFMADMPEERLTLITCWPYGINDHRVIVVAVPAD
jgi:LPXTG-site transpeptidase (sortase) family protein